MTNQPASFETYRYRICFGKDGSLRWIGHLDFQQCWERMIRRAELPLAFSRGFHPHPKIVFGAALPLGFSAKGEWVDIGLDAPHEADDILQRLSHTSQPGLHIHSVQKLGVAASSIGRQVIASRYCVRLPHANAVTADAVDRLLATTKITRTRRNKDYDLRPLIENLRLDDENQTLVMQLTCKEGATGRPEEVLHELAIDPHDCEICREALLLTMPAA